MANRFTKVTPVEYIPGNTNLMLQAGLVKDNKVQKELNNYTNSIDYLGNIPTIYDLDFKYKNEKFDQVRSKIQTLVKSNNDILSPQSKQEFNNIINDSVKDLGLYNSQQRVMANEALSKTITDETDRNFLIAKRTTDEVYETSGNPNSRYLTDIVSAPKSVDVGAVLRADLDKVASNIYTNKNGDYSYKKSTNLVPLTNASGVTLTDPNTGEILYQNNPIELAYQNATNNSKVYEALVNEWRANNGKTLYDNPTEDEMKDVLVKKAWETGKHFIKQEIVEEIKDDNNKTSGKSSSKGGRTGSDGYALEPVDNVVINGDVVSNKLTEGFTYSSYLNNMFKGINPSLDVILDVGGEFIPRDFKKVSYIDLNENKYAKDKFDKWSSQFDNSPTNPNYKLVEKFKKGTANEQERQQILYKFYDYYKNLNANVTIQIEQTHGTSGEVLTQKLSNKDFSKSQFYNPKTGAIYTGDELEYSGYDMVNGQIIGTYKGAVGYENNLEDPNQIPNLAAGSAVNIVKDGRQETLIMLKPTQHLDKDMNPNSPNYGQYTFQDTVDRLLEQPKFEPGIPTKINDTYAIRYLPENKLDAAGYVLTYKNSKGEIEYWKKDGNQFITTPVYNKLSTDDTQTLFDSPGAKELILSGSKQDNTQSNSTNVSSTITDKRYAPMLNLLKDVEAKTYDTLLGNSEDRFTPNKKVSQMTVDELLDFSNPSGVYGTWSKTLKGKSNQGTASTPMGKYQILGTTLRNLKRAMGLKGDEIFTPEMQDKMFLYLLNNRLGLGNDVASKRKQLRSEWEGLNNISDKDLDLAINQIENS